MKIGILGGSFNPVHLGHVRIALDVRNTLGLDEVWFMCASYPPHKKDVLPYYHRYNMLNLAIKGYPHFYPSDIEIKNGFKFTYDTLTYLKKVYGRTHEFYFLLGFDAFLEINTWKEWQKLLTLTNFVIFNRFTAHDNIRNIMQNFFSVELKASSDGTYFSYEGKRIYHLKLKSLNISGSEIREAVKKGNDVRTLVCKEVADYIEKNGLFR